MHMEDSGVDQLFACAMNEKHSTQALVELLIVPHITVRLNVLVMIREVDED